MSRSGGWGGAQAELERLPLTEGGAGAGATGEMPKGFRTSKDIGEQSQVRMREVRAEME